MTTTCKPFDVVEVPFPFIESPQTKRRVALVLSDEEFQTRNGAVILAMITSARRSRWSGDVEIIDTSVAGLRSISVVRWKVFTLERKLIENVRGSLSSRDTTRITQAARTVLGSLIQQTTS